MFKNLPSNNCFHSSSSNAYQQFANKITNVINLNKNTAQVAEKCQQLKDF